MPWTISRHSNLGLSGKCHQPINFTKPPDLQHTRATDTVKSCSAMKQRQGSIAMQVRLAKLRGRQQALFNCISILLLLGLVSAASIWKPHFLYLGRVWRIVRVDSKMQSYAELGSEGLVWGLLLSMGWPWNLLIYPVHLTRKELTNARKGSRFVPVWRYCCCTQQRLLIWPMHLTCKELTNARTGCRFVLVRPLG